MMVKVEQAVANQPGQPSFLTAESVSPRRRHTTYPPTKTTAKQLRHTMMLQMSKGSSLTNSPADAQMTVEIRTMIVPATSWLAGLDTS